MRWRSQAASPSEMSKKPDMAKHRNVFTPPEIAMVTSHKVSCNGGGALGHPKVWYEMGDEDFVECKYCDRRFVLIGGSEDPNRPR